MDIIDAKIKDVLSQDINEPYSYEKMIKNTLYQKKKINFLQVIKTSISIILGILISTGTVFAGYTIYNEYIKKEEQIASRGLFDDGSGHTSYEIDLMSNDMTWHDDTRLYHKIIANIDDYNKYKSRVTELPNMTEQDLNENFLLVIANENYREAQELDIHISEVYCDNNNTYITLKQKENPNYDDDTNIWYAIIDKSQLRDNINIKIEHKEIKNENFVDIKTLSKDYSVQDARKDGCIIVENEKTSEMDKIDEFLKTSKNDESGFIRIYCRKDNYYGINELEIIDLQYENGLYYLAKRIIYSDFDNRNIDKVCDYSLFNITKKEFRLKGEEKSFVEIIGQKYKDSKFYGDIPILILEK